MPARSAFDREGQLPPPLRRRPGRRGTMADAVGLIPDGATVYVTGLMGTPISLVEAVAGQFGRWRRLTTTADYLLNRLATFDRPEDVVANDWPFHHVTVQPSRATASLGEGRLRIVSAHSSQFYRLFQPGGALAVDVALVQVSEPGPDGRFSMGVSGGAALEVVCRAEVVIAEVNPAMPYIAGPSAFERHDFDVLVEVDHPLWTLPSPSGSPTLGGSTPQRYSDSPAAIIGELVASEVPDGAVVEYGIGTIPDAAVEALAGHHALGLHSGLIGDAAISLIEAGAMDGSAKQVDPGLHVASAVLGSQRSVDWVRDRDDVVIVASNYSHGVPVLSRHENFVAINSAIEVAVDGSINAEQVGDRILSGPGGQPDFAAAAALSAGGRSFVALPATVGGRASEPTSRIVERLAANVPVTVPRYLADQVVTEFGIARLRGADRRQRSDRMWSIADPRFRPADAWWAEMRR